jgi:DNA polymerase-3 subunit gamma/tau
MGKFKKKIEKKKRPEGQLHLKYRPQNFEEMFGNQDVIDLLKTFLKREPRSIPRTFLITGPSGCGKTTLGRIIKNELNCLDLDFKEYNASNYRGIDIIRYIINLTQYKAWGYWRVFLLDECHQLTEEAQNAILKLLEEPPKNHTFILCTTKPEKLIDTLKNRCTSLELSTLSMTEILRLLKWVCKEEGMNDYPEEILRKIAGSCKGIPRRALFLLDEVRGLTDKVKAFKIIEKDRIVKDKLPPDYFQ